MEFDFHSYNKRLQQISVPVGALKQPWWPRWLAYAETAVDQRGGTPDAANHLQEWAERHGAFDEVIYQDHWIPTAPWCMQAPWKHWGDEMREDIYAFMASGRVPESVVNELEEKATEELGGARYGTYIRLQRVIARKRQGWIAPEVVFEQERLRRQQEEEQQQQQSFQAMTI